MKQLLPTTIAAVLLGGESQQSSPPAEAESAEPVVEAAKPEPTTAKAPDISFWKAAMNGNIEAVKQQLAAGADVNAKDGIGWTPLHSAAGRGRKEVNELLITNGADVNAKDAAGNTPLDLSISKLETANLLRKHGGKTGEELKAEGK